jgi:hypothetical protein
MRKTVLLGLLAALIVTGWAANSQAAVYTCQVNAVGVESGNFYVYLTDDANATFTLTRFLLGNVNSTQAASYYATALEAIGSQSDVYADLDLTTFAVTTTNPHAGFLSVATGFTP